jgi:hypothetical protein
LGYFLVEKSGGIVMGRSMRRNWKRTIELWRKSGLSKADFCRQNSISLRSFSYHSLKHGAFSNLSEGKLDGEKALEKVPASEFAEVVCKSVESESRKSKPSMLLRLDCGCSLELRADFDVKILKRLLRVTAEL